MGQGQEEEAEDLSGEYLRARAGGQQDKDESNS